MLLETITGSESFSTPTPASFSVDCRYVIASIPPQPLQTAARDARSGCRMIGSVERLPASSMSAKNGQWEIGRYDVPVGSMLLLHIKRRQSGGILYDNFRVYLHMREGSALRQIRIPFTDNQFSNMACGYMQGNFDIVRPDWFEHLKLDPLYPEHYDQTYIEDWFTSRELEPETAPFRPVATVAVTTASGKEIRLPKVAGTRKLTMPKRSK